MDSVIIDYLREANIQDIIVNETFLFIAFFIVMIYGMYATFRWTLTHTFFKRKEGFEQASNKVVNVVSFMIAFIGVSGLFFVLKQEGGGMQSVVAFLGGIGGIVVLMTLCSMVMHKFWEWRQDIASNGRTKWANIVFTVGLSLCMIFLGSYLIIWSKYFINYSEVFAYIGKNLLDIGIILGVVVAILSLFGLFKSKEDKEGLPTSTSVPSSTSSESDSSTSEPVHFDEVEKLKKLIEKLKNSVDSAAGYLRNISTKVGK